MAKQILVVLVALVILAVASLAVAQDQPEPEEKVFNLIVGGEEAEKIEEDVADDPEFEPALETGRWHFGLTLGYANTSGTLLEHNNIIYKVTDEAVFYGDVEIKGQSAFNPTLRLTYGLTSWLALETSLGLVFAEYEGDISDPYSIELGSEEEPQAVPEVGEFDPENRSMLSALANINALVFPFNFDGDSKGRLHPYVTGGIGYAAYTIDSDYTDEGSSSINLNGGLGLMLIADDLITVRFEMLYEVHTIGFEPGEYYRELDSGTVKVPIYEFTDTGQFREVSEFSSNSLSVLTWQLGFMVGF